MPSKPTLSKLASIRSDLSDAQSALADLPDRPLPVTEAIERASAWVDTKAEAFDSYRAARVFAETDSAFALSTLFDFDVSQIGEQPGRANATPMLCWLHGDALKAKLAAEIEGLTLDDPLPMADRGPEKQRLKALVAKLEIEEEVLIRQIEDNGEPVQRRPDADLSVICAPDLELAEAA